MYTWNSGFTRELYPVLQLSINNPLTLQHDYSLLISKREMVVVTGNYEAKGSK